MDAKKISRAIAAYLLGTFLFFALFLTAYSLVFRQITASPDRVKQILSDSGVYSKIPGVIYDNSVDSGGTSSASIPLKDSVVRQAALDTFDPSFVQKSFESIIDGTYGWLKGQTDQPEFSIDLKKEKELFAKNLAEQTGERLKSLPACSPSQLKKIKAIDPYELACLPPGLDISAVKKEVRSTAANSDNLLKQTKIDPTTIKDSAGKPMYLNYADLPKSYENALKLPYLAVSLCLLLGAGVVFIRKDRREGLHKLGQILLVSGFFVALAPMAINHLVGSVLNSSSDDQIISQIVKPVAGELGKAASKVYLVVGAVYVLLATAIYIITERSKPAKTAKKQGKSR